MIKKSHLTTHIDRFLSKTNYRIFTEVIDHTCTCTCLWKTFEFMRNIWVFDGMAHSEILYLTDYMFFNCEKSTMRHLRDFLSETQL